MEAKDTVMRDSSLTKLIKEYEEDARNQSAPLIEWEYILHRTKYLINIQAEISYKAGYEQGWHDASIPKKGVRV